MKSLFQVRTTCVFCEFCYLISSMYLHLTVNFSSAEKVVLINAGNIFYSTVR